MKDVTYTEEFLAQDREYNSLVNAGNRLGKFLGRTGNKIKATKGIVGAAKTAVTMGTNETKDPKAESKAKMKAIMEAKGIPAHAEATRSMMKTNNIAGKVGATGAGVVVGGAAGAGLTNLAMTKSKARIAYLEGKGELSPRESATLAQLKRKVKSATVIGGVAGAAVGGVAGHLLGKKYAKGVNKKLAKAHVRKKFAVMREVKKAEGNN